MQKARAMTSNWFRTKSIKLARSWKKLFFFCDITDECSVVWVSRPQPFGPSDGFERVGDEHCRKLGGVSWKAVEHKRQLE